MKAVIYDTTLRDGTQGEGLQLSVTDKIAITRLLDELGVRYVEGGWPGSNPRDEDFFREVRTLSLSTVKITAFGSTRRAAVTCDADANLQALLKAETPAVTIFGKSWKFHATNALGISPEQNLELIEDSVRYMKARVGEVIFDAEHFFDGFADDENYALSAISAAAAGGADWIVLCDTNGGSLPEAIRNAVEKVRLRVNTPLGIHTHDDAELAVANALTAVRVGATMVQGTINGYGERCGNANLISLIPTLMLKMGVDCIPRDRLSHLTRVAHAVDEIGNQVPRSSQAYVGRSAFAHKGGVHVNAVLKDSRTYEHIDPETVGNRRRVLVSDLSGKANLLAKAEEYGVALDPDAPEARRILDKLKTLENRGFQFEGAEASFRLLVDEAYGRRHRYFTLHDLDVHAQVNGKRLGEEDSGTAVARIRLDVGGVLAETTAEGNGPVDAMDAGLRKLINKFYPTLQSMKLIDYKVRVLSDGAGTGSIVRVLVQSGDGDEVWSTVGVSPNIIEASFQAMVDAIDYKLVKDGVNPHI